MPLSPISDFRVAYPDCALLVLSDIRSGTVLAADGALTYPQEYLDAVSASASALLQAKHPPAPHAVFYAPSSLRLVLHLPHLGDIALTCLTHPSADAPAMMAALTTFAETLDPAEAAA